MVRDYNAALQFVQDYFNMDFKKFIATYFKGDRAKEIERNITPEKYNQLFGELSDKQAEIINDADSKEPLNNSYPNLPNIQSCINE